MPKWNHNRWRRLGRYGFLAVLALIGLVALGISGADEAAFRGFDEATARWQANPEFRAVAIDYCVRGSRAMRTRPMGVPSRRVIVALRSIPGLPNDIAVNPTSRLHYENFTRGPLSAYLHLCSEQQVDQFIGVFEAAGQKREPGEANLRQVLDAFHMDFPVCKDAGALQSAGTVIRESDAYRRFAIRGNVGPLLLPHIAALSATLHLPADPRDLSPDEQAAVLDRLDGYVRVHDPELWRTKQISDFCGGIWAQVFSPPYVKLLTAAIAVHRWCQYAFALLLIGWVVWLHRKIRRGPKQATGSSSV